MLKRHVNIYMLKRNLSGSSVSDDCIVHIYYLHRCTTLKLLQFIVNRNSLFLLLENSPVQPKRRKACRPVLSASQGKHRVKLFSCGNKHRLSLSYCQNVGRELLSVVSIVVDGGVVVAF